MKDFEAYYSKVGAWLYLAAAIVLLVPVVLLSIAWIDGFSLPIILLLSLIAALCALIFGLNVAKSGAAIEISDGEITLNKKTPVTLSLDEVDKVYISEGSGYVNVIIKCGKKRYSIHCFLKNKRLKIRELADILDDSSIKVYAPN